MEDYPFDETEMRRAYSKATKLKRSGLDKEVVYARLEKQGFPDELIAHVLHNISAQQKETIEEEKREYHQYGLIYMGVGVVIAIISTILLPGVTILPIGLIVGGIILALITSKAS